MGKADYADISYMYGEDVAKAMTGGGDVTITREEYERFVEESAWLSALNQAGVDNWDGVDFAQEIYDAFNVVTEGE